jgi:hypothetical protein
MNSPSSPCAQQRAQSVAGQILVTIPSYTTACAGGSVADDRDRHLSDRPPTMSALRELQPRRDGAYASRSAGPGAGARRCAHRARRSVSGDRIFARRQRRQMVPGSRNSGFDERARGRIQAGTEPGQEAGSALKVRPADRADRQPVRRRTRSHDRIRIHQAAKRAGLVPPGRASGDSPRRPDAVGRAGRLPRPRAPPCRTRCA